MKTIIQKNKQKNNKNSYKFGKQNKDRQDINNNLII